MANTDAILICDSRFEYDTALLVRRTTCRLCLFEADGRLIALASELADNPGASITNTAAALATALVRDYVVDPTRVLLIEHYDYASYRGFSPEPSFDLLRFTWTADLATHPQWQRLTETELAALGLPEQLWSTPPATLSVQRTKLPLSAPWIQ